jgi:hypothetical protein
VLSALFLGVAPLTLPPELLLEPFSLRLLTLGVAAVDKGVRLGLYHLATRYGVQRLMLFSLAFMRLMSSGPKKGAYPQSK